MREVCDKETNRIHVSQILIRANVGNGEQHYGSWFDSVEQEHLR